MSRSRLLHVALPVAFLQACSGGSGGGDPEPPSAVKTIGPSGGEVALSGGAALTVPAGALNADVRVSITQSSAARPQGALGPVFEFGPSGTTFATPVTVTFPIPQGTTEASVYFTLPGSTEYDALPTTIAGAVATAEVTHFSAGFLGAPCSPGAGCTPLPNVCHLGVTTCNGRPACVDTGASVGDGAACGLGGTCTAGVCTGETQIPDPPTGLVAVPGNESVTLAWTPAVGAATYRVYHSASSSVTTASTSVPATGATVPVSPLANGAVRFFAVTAVNEAGESLLSERACAVPTAADQTGLTLYDGLCGATLSGARWVEPGAFSTGVSDGAAALSVDVAEMEARSLRGTTYTASASVNDPRRVTALAADLTVPAESAARAGAGTVIRSEVRLAYQPPQQRLSYPAANLDYVALAVGLADAGDGLRAYRYLTHCDDASCASTSTSGIAFTDPQQLGSVAGLPGARGVAAAYGTPYRVTARLDPATGVFHWSIGGGPIFGSLSGTADASEYLAATPAWSALGASTQERLAAGFKNALLLARVQDQSDVGGGSGRITGRFDGVSVGFDGAAAAPYDDFGGSAGNSGPAELSMQKWSPGGRRSVLPSGGGLTLDTQVTSPSNGGTGAFTTVALANPSGVNTVQADVTLTSFSTSGGPTPDGWGAIAARLYNDGSGVANSALGDVTAFLQVHEGQLAGITVWIQRCDDATCSSITKVGSGRFGPIAPTLGQTHTLRLGWDPATKRIAFGVDGQPPVLVDPQTAGNVTTAAATIGITAPVAWAGPPHAPQKQLMTSAGIPASTDPPSAGASASVQMKVNNVFTAP
jgi:hypothetical protein